MGYSYKRGSPQFRQLLGTLLVAWSLVTGCAAVFASALYYRSGDLKVIIAYLGAPLVVGSALLVMIAFTGAAVSVKDKSYAPPTGMRVRNDIHGLKDQRPK